jgi:hypothetical protein
MAAFISNQGVPIDKITPVAVIPNNSGFFKRAEILPVDQARARVDDEHVVVAAYRMIGIYLPATLER